MFQNRKKLNETLNIKTYIKPLHSSKGKKINKVPVFHSLCFLFIYVVSATIKHIKAFQIK